MRKKRNSDMRAFDRLIGSWKLTGDATGLNSFEWMDGRHFLLQHVDMKYGGRRIQGLEVIGHLHRIDEKPSIEIRSRFYSSNDGLTLDYVHELAGDTYTIWFGEKGSDNRFKGKFTSDGNVYSGAWSWPGGGYLVTCTRVGCGKIMKSSISGRFCGTIPYRTPPGPNLRSARSP
jgi:hypothetical protein